MQQYRGTQIVPGAIAQAALPGQAGSIPQEPDKSQPPTPIDEATGNGYNENNDSDPMASDVAGDGAEENAGNIDVSNRITKDEGEFRTQPSRTYDINAKPNGTPTRIAENVDDVTKRSLMRENETAEVLARNGYDIEQNPVIEGTTRNPDYIIEGKVFDCYSPYSNTRVRNIWSTIEEKVTIKQQADNIVINLDDWNGNIDDIINQFKNYSIEGLKEVIAVKNGKVFNIYP